jgi:hypothetical protein
MDALTVFTKTARGVKEVASGAALKKNELAILKLVDGKSSVSEISSKASNGREAEQVLAMLEKQGYTRVFEVRAGEAGGAAAEAEADDFDFTSQMQVISNFAESEPKTAPTPTLSAEGKTEILKAQQEADALRLKAQEDVQRAHALKLETEIKAFEHAEAAMALRAEAEEHAKAQLKQAIMLKEAAEKKAREELERAAALRTEMQKQLAEAEEDNYRLREQLKSELAEVARLKAQLAAQLQAGKGDK